MGLIERVLSWLGVEQEPGNADAQAPPQAVSSGGREAAAAAEATPRRARVVTLPTAAAPTQAGGAAPRTAARLVVFEPRGFEDVQAVAMHLREGRPVVLTLKATDRDTARRIVDFLSGTVYALDGTMRRVDDDLFLCAPSGVDVLWEGLSSQ